MRRATALGSGLQGKGVSVGLSSEDLVFFTTGKTRKKNKLICSLKEGPHPRTKIP